MHVSTTLTLSEKLNTFAKITATAAIKRQADYVFSNDKK